MKFLGLMCVLMTFVVAAASDANGQGNMDLAVVNGNAPSFSILKNNGNGTFTGKEYSTNSYGPVSVFATDLNGDGKPDLAMAILSSDAVSVNLNNGDGTFTPIVLYGTAASPNSVFAADLNGDGKPDLAASCGGGSVVSVLINNGNGTFAPKVDYLTGNFPFSVFVADLNGDGRPDLATANGNPFTHIGTISVLINKGDGTFVPKVDYPTGDESWSVFATDLNGDGKPDLMTANGSFIISTISIFINKGDGTFVPKVDYPTGSSAGGFFAADLNGDGKPDLAVANYDSNAVSVLINKGDGTFAPNEKVDYQTGNGPWSVFATDLNGDGKPDLAVANSGGRSGEDSTVSILLNNGDGTFAPRVDYRSGILPGSISAANFGGHCAGVKGDLNADGNFTPPDVVLMLNCVFLGSGGCDLCFADANCDGLLTPSDVILELNLVFLGLAFPC